MRGSVDSKDNLMLVHESCTAPRDHLRRRDHLRFTSGIICGSGSFAVEFGDHLRSEDHLRSGIICGAVHHLLWFVKDDMSVRAIFHMHSNFG